METPTPARLVVVYDVTGLTDEQIGSLEMCAAVQAERVRPDEETEAGHPDVPVLSFVTRDALFMRIIDSQQGADDAA